MNIDELITLFDPIARHHNIKPSRITRSDIFNNAYADYQFDGVTLRLIVDRGLPSVEVRPTNEITSWRDISEFMDLLCEGPQFGERQLGEVLDFVDLSLPLIATEYQRNAKLLDAKIEKLSAEFVKHHFGW